MRDSLNFVKLEAFRNIMIEGSSFINVEYSAIMLQFSQDYYTPNQTIIRNCLFQMNDNNSNYIYQGNAFYFTSLPKMSDQFSLNVISFNNTFLNYQHGSKIYTLSVTLLT